MIFVLRTRRRVDPDLQRPHCLRPVSPDHYAAKIPRESAAGTRHLALSVRAGGEPARSVLTTGEQAARAAAEDGGDEVALERLRAGDELDPREPVRARVRQLALEVADAV